MSIIGHHRLMVLTGQSKASPTLGKALGSLEINMMQFLKEFNARTTKVRPNVTVQVTVTPRTDRSYKFTIRSPSTSYFIKRASRSALGASSAAAQPVSYLLTKEAFHVAKAKCMDPQLLGQPIYTIMKSVIGCSKSMGIVVDNVPDSRWPKRDNIMPSELEGIRKERKLQNKANKRSKK